MPINQTDIRQHNKSTVLKYIMKNKEISRAGISASTKLNKVTVSEIVKDLIDQKLVIESGIGKSTIQGGRKPIKLKFNYKAGVTLGVDVGINSIRLVSSYLNGEIINKEKIKHKHSDVNKIIKSFFNEKKEKYKNLPYKIVGSTISVQGIVHENEIFFTPNYKLTDIEKLSEYFDFPIHFENEANLAAFSHMSYDNGDNCTPVAAITLRTGIGSGIIINHEIYHGFESRSGELGHTIVVPNGLQCPCGNKGCLELYASEKALLNKFKERKNIDDLSIEDFVEAYNNNDEDAIEVLHEISEFLASGVNNFIALFAIEKMYLVSNLSAKLPFFVDSINEKLHGVFAKDNKIINSEFDKYASALGAAKYSTHKFLDDLK